MTTKALDHAKERELFIATLKEVAADMLAYAEALEKEYWDAEWRGSALALRAQGAVYDELFPDDIVLNLP